MRRTSKENNLFNESSKDINILKAPRWHLACVGFRLWIEEDHKSLQHTVQWFESWNEYCVLFLIRDKGNVCQSLCEGEEHTETARKDMWVMPLTFKNLFLCLSTLWRTHGFLIEAVQSFPLHIRSFSLWHLPRDCGEPGTVANNSLRLIASESQMSRILNHLLLTYFFPLYSSFPPRGYLSRLQGGTSILCWVRCKNPDLQISSL